MKIKEFTFFKFIKSKIPETLLNVLPSLKNILVLGITFYFFNWWYRSLTEIGDAEFSKLLLANTPTQYFIDHNILILPLFGICFLLLFRYRLILTKWDVFVPGKQIQLIIGACTVAFAWIHISYPLNYFMFEDILLERLLLLLLTALTIWRPFFVIIYLLYPLLLHYGEPLLVNNWSVTELPMRVLLLFASQLILFLLLGKSKWNLDAFIFLLVCVIAGNYFPAGLGKLVLNWFSKDHIYLLFPSMYADGWMNFLNPDTVSNITVFLSKFNFLLKVGTIVLEFGCAFMLFRKGKSLVFYLIGFTVFHFIVFILTGIGFWPWMIVECLLLLFIMKRKEIHNVIQRFTIWHIVLSFFLIATTPIWLMGSVFAWYESPVNYVYEFEVEDNNGNTCIIPSKFFWPKYFEFYRTDFHFLNKQPTLPVSWGTTVDDTLIEKLLKAKTAEDVFILEKEFGVHQFDENMTEEFKNYFNRFVQEKARYQLTTSPWFSLLSAPPQRVTFGYSNICVSDKVMVKLVIYQKTVFFNGKDYNEIRRVPMLEYDISNSE